MSDNSLPRQNLGQNLDRWLNSMSSLLGEISTVEITTTIVDEIVDDVFLPYEVYQAIYSLSPTYLSELEIHLALRDRYLRLRRQLELEYALLLIDENSSLHNPQLAPEVTRDLPLLASDRTSWESMPCRLPPPVNYNHDADRKLLSQLLSEPHFTVILRQLGAIKTTLDRRNRQLTGSNLESSLESSSIPQQVTYAQTTIQLDGKIANRYAAEIINHPQQTAIIELHQQGIKSGEKQWHQLLKFVMEIVQRQHIYH